MKSVPGLKNCEIHFHMLIHLNSKIKQFTKGECLYNIGDPSNEAYIIKSGNFAVIRKHLIFIKIYMAYKII